ncbi:MAG TPA: hypothetical protein VFJ82_24160 [Longimicrobium sp.]|nr:hypothetical protein [Longimicrobium sp.]
MTIPPIRFAPAAMTLAMAALAAACSDATSPVDGRDACSRLGVPGTYAGDVSLGRGEAVKLAGGTQLCLAVPGSAADAYALAFVDTRPIQASLTAQEPASGDGFGVTVGAAGSTRATRLAALSAPAEPSDVREWAFSHADADDAGNRATPWTQGESFRVVDLLQDSVRPATVQRVYDGWLVVAVYTDQPEPALAGMLQNLDTAWPTLRATGVPLLRKLLSDSLPMTSGGSHQLLVVIRGDIPGASGLAFGESDGARTLTQIALRPYADPGNAPFVASLLFHEVTHAFQRQYISATRPAAAPPTLHAGAARWAIEGGATLMQAEFARRLAGISWASNWDFRNPNGTAQAFYSRFAFTGTGPFVGGYSPPAGFMRDLAERRVRRGEAVDDALAAVMRGAIEGWYGHGPSATDRPGLAARMRSALGGDWDPADAMLTWTLSHAADDRTSSGTFQDAAFLRAWDTTDPGAWPAAGTLAPGSAPVTLAQERESTHWFELAGGGTYAVSSTVDGVQWMLVRMK